jgi:hypothetical protein
VQDIQSAQNPNPLPNLKVSKEKVINAPKSNNQRNLKSKHKRKCNSKAKKRGKIFIVSGVSHH